MKFYRRAAKNGSQADEDEQEDPCVRAEREFYQIINEVVVVLTKVFSYIGMKYNYRMLRNVFGMSSTP